MTEKKRGRPPTGKAVPISKRVAKARQKLKASGGRRVEFLLDDASYKALQVCKAANRSVTFSQLVGALLQREAASLK